MRFFEQRLGLVLISDNGITTSKQAMVITVKTIHAIETNSKRARNIGENLREIGLKKRFVQASIAIYQRRFSFPSIDRDFWPFINFY